MAKAPQSFLGYTALLGDPVPSKWDRVKQALWDTNLNAPIRGVYNLMNADPYTLYTDEGAAGQQAAVDSFDAGGGITVGSAMVPKPSNAMAMGIKAYHGSPHSFDKFSMDKIGTGEGAQAYGHGLYFAEQEDIARSYRDALSPKKVAIGGEMVDSPTFFKAARRSPSVDDNIAMLTKQRENILKEQSQYTSDPELGDFVSELYDTQLKDVNREIAELSQYKGGWFGTRPGGSMYEVNIDADPNAFLDWDKPLGEQPDVQARLATIGEAARSSTTKGVDKYISLENMLGAIDWPDNADAAVRAQYRKGAAARVSEKLKEAGIPGIKYLDAGSRGKGVAHVQPMYKGKPYGDPIPATAWNQVDQLTQRYKDMGYDVEVQDLGTRNYVVFDDKLISIVKKYGIAGASAMLGYDVLTGANEAQAKAVNKADLDHRYDNFLKSGGI